MKIILTIGLSLLLTSCGTQWQSASRDFQNPESEPKPHVGGSMKTILGDTDLETILKPILENGAKGEELERLQEQFLSASDLRPDELTGHARLIFEGLGSILEQAQQGFVPKEAPTNTHKECVEAYSQKVAWHIENRGVPANFGKITEYVLTPVKGTNYWVGAIDLCTWIGAENYYFNISFIEKKDKSLTLISEDISSVIPNFTEADLSRFNYKLHAKGTIDGSDLANTPNDGRRNGDGSIIYKNVFKNGVFIGPTDPIYDELEQDCFDTFYVQKPTGIKAIDLADQIGYCMGRCNGKVLNTGI